VCGRSRSWVAGGGCGGGTLNWCRRVRMSGPRCEGAESGSLPARHSLSLSPTESSSPNRALCKTTMQASDDAVLICLTPTRNEAWIIKQFLAAAKNWADHIVVADQGSTDGTLQELKSTSGVEVVINDSAGYDEAYRRGGLRNRARQDDGNRVVIGLDADEAVSANWLYSEDWERIKGAKPGAILRFRWVNILRGFTKWWIPPNHSAFGYVDEGWDFNGWR